MAARTFDLRAVAIALLSVGCTVAIPDADKFPEARDVQAIDVALDAALDVAETTHEDGNAHEVVDKADAAPDAATDASDAQVADAADVTSPDAAVVDAAVDAADTVTAADAADAVAPVDADDVGLDVPPACTASDCDDANPCTSDDCAAGGGCTHLNVPPGPCPDDGKPCTGDACVDGVCSHTTLLAGWCIVGGTCYADGATTADGCGVCAPSTTPVAWTPLPDTATCSDGTACTVGDHCQSGACLPGDVTTCDDGNACTADVCDPAVGCSNANVPDGSGCPAPGVCKLPGFCSAGVCLSAPKLWSTSFDGGTGGADSFAAVATTASGQIIVAGARTATGGAQEGWAQRLTASAELVETLPALVAPSGDAHYSAAAVAADGTIALGGALTAQAVVLLVYPDGTQQTVQPFAKWSATDVDAIVAQGDGWLVLDNAGHVARLDASGASVWTAAADGCGASELRSIVGLADGGALAVGSCSGGFAQGPTALAIRVSAAGAITWQRAFGAQGAAFANVLVTGDGIAHVTGSCPGNGGTLAWFGHITLTGRWLGEQAVPLGNLAPLARARPASDGTWRFVGTDGSNATLSAYDLYGSLLWQHAYDAGAATDLSFLPGDGVVLAGVTGSPTDGALVRADPWGEATCAASQLCSNLTLVACTDAATCSVDLCSAGTCGHTTSGTSPCDDGALCTIDDACATGKCVGGGDALFDATDLAAGVWSRVAPWGDGGAVVTDGVMTVARLDAGGNALWQQLDSGGAITGILGLANGWVVVLRGEAGGTMRRFTADGAALAAAVDVDGAAAGSAAAFAELADGAVVVVGTSQTGTGAQAAFVERFDANWNGQVTPLPGSFGLSSGLDVAAASAGGCAVLTIEGAVARLHRLDASLGKVWDKPLAAASASHVAEMPDGGWMVAGLGSKGLALERSGPEGAFEFAQQWPIAGLSGVNALTVLPDGVSVVAAERIVNGKKQGGLVRFGPLGGLLSATWSGDDAQLLDVVATQVPAGIWAVGTKGGMAWRLRTDAHGGLACATSGACISQSLLCDDGNPCTADGCTLGQCTIAAPAEAATCLNGGVCSPEGACPLLGTCGDGKCNVEETSANCAADCQPACDAMNCNDGDPCTIDYCQAGACAIGGAPDGTACALGKACSFGQCIAPGCGDGLCEPGETVTSCASDCFACGDGLCGAGENNHLCPADCPKPASGCQNLCGWKSVKPGGGVCWCDANCTPGPFGDCCDDKATFCP